MAQDGNASGPSRCELGPGQTGKRLETELKLQQKQWCTHMAPLPVPWCPHPSHCLCSPPRCPFWTLGEMAAQSPLYGRSAHQPLNRGNTGATKIVQFAVHVTIYVHDIPLQVFLAVLHFIKSDVVTDGNMVISLLTWLLSRAVVITTMLLQG